MTYTRRGLMAAAPLILAGGLAMPVAAQVTVYDPAAVAQMVKQVSQGLQQIQALQQQLASAQKMLQSLGLDVTGPLKEIAGQATALLRQAQGLGYTAADISRDYADLYGADLSGLTPTALAAKLAAWSRASDQTLKDALGVQNQIVQAQDATSGAVSGAVAASQAAQGQTAAIQATNQLLSALSTQLTQLQTLLITQGRQVQTLEAEKRALSAKAEADAERLSKVTRPSSSPSRTSL